MRKYSVAQLALPGMIALTAMLAGCKHGETSGLTASEPAIIAPAYADGEYRGFYTDGGIEQFSVSFTLDHGIYERVALRSVNYKDGDYLSKNATRIQEQVASQYQEAAQYLSGKPVSALYDLLDAADVTSDRDAVTSATLRTGKLVSAIQDGLSHGVYAPAGDEIPEYLVEIPDGEYRGSYREGTTELVSIGVLMHTNRMQSVDIKCGMHGMDGALQDLEDYLTGRDAATVFKLYHPESLLASETLHPLKLEGGMLVSAFRDAWNRGAYQTVETTVFPELSGFANGIYRGFFFEGGSEQISVQFELVNDTFVDIVFRGLSYADGDYLSEDAPDEQKAIHRQYLALAAHLKGQPLSTVYDLYRPEEIATDADACSAATLPSNKLISALMDGLHRGIYRQGDIDS